MKSSYQAHLALSAVALIYGSNYIIAKDVMNDGYLGPWGFILLRVLTAVILFSLVHRAWLYEKVERKDYFLLAICGVFGVAVNQLCFFSGLERTSPIHASLIMTTTPILVIIAGTILANSSVSIAKVLGIASGLLGAVILITQADKGSQSTATFFGDLLIFINASSYAVYLVLVKKMLAKYQPITVIRWVFTFGLLYVFPFGMSEAWSASYSEFPMRIWMSVAFVLLFTTFFAYLLNAFALSKVSASTASFYIYFQPLIASMIAVFLGREHIEVHHLVAAFFLFAGVYLVSKKEKNVKIT